MNNNILKRCGFLIVALVLASCSKDNHQPEHKAEIHYIIGQPYQLGERWMYPEENFAYKGTGIAVVSKEKVGKITADGEIYNPQLMTGAHPTLQLPAIVKVRNLDNGREVVIRLNDRTTSAPPRELEVTPKVAELLGFTVQSPAKVEIIEDEAQSQKIALEMPNGPQTQMQVETAPLDTIKVENLDGSSSIQNHSLEQPKDNGIKTPMSLPEFPAVYTQGVATGGQLWIDGGSFTSKIYADRLAAKMGGHLAYTYTGGRRVIRVRSGPYSTVEQADQNLDYLLKSGIKGAKIIVE
ncbi:septal ring lytic transglycosylase RlpA family protein [Commensalibacter oyaizuii]|uniref:RlpA-like double-psi beta-barrel domain-containing protein n=1 Tax=Commensalibacter oyaizuii TaxID=3043873 RepID=A0ABT6Q062_9PROT|nr:RlpA-like double-psi beta-barrel domain-containing protein [Commensalibacter sp. TBRC 16381]MDI2090348.1 RlpA-like double-psi beta-barrel domain-containing protein [Commensalibacter sp. TBRC 16381]